MKFDIENIVLIIDHDKQLIHFDYGDDDENWAEGVVSFDREEFGERVGYTANISYKNFEFDVLNSSSNLSAFEESELVHCIITKAGL